MENLKHLEESLTSLVGVDSERGLKVESLLKVAQNQLNLLGESVEKIKNETLQREILEHSWGVSHLLDVIANLVDYDVFLHTENLIFYTKEFLKEQQKIA